MCSSQGSVGSAKTLTERPTVAYLLPPTLNHSTSTGQALTKMKLERSQDDHAKEPDTLHHPPLTPHKSYFDLQTSSITPSAALMIPKVHLPPTPETTPNLSTRALKRPLPSDHESSPSAGRQSKRRASPPDSTITPFVNKYLFPPTPDKVASVKRPLFRKPNLNNPKTPSVAAIELKRASEAILRQIDWQEVTEYVACNRRALIYKNAVKGVLQNAVDGLFEEERRREEGEQ